MRSRSFLFAAIVAMASVLTVEGGCTDKVFSRATFGAARPVDASRSEPLIVQVRGGGPKPAKTASSTKPTATGSCVIPSFFKTQTSLQVLGCSMLIVGVSYLVAPESTHSKLFLLDSSVMAHTYQQLSGMRELLIGTMSLFTAWKGSEELRRCVAALVALILCPLQLRLLLTSKDVFAENMVGTMIFSQAFYLIYLSLSAYLSWQQREKK